MKKKHFIFIACLLAGCVGGIYGGMTSPHLTKVL